MNQSIRTGLLGCAIASLAYAPAIAITIDTVPIGNPGNAHDPADGAASLAGIQHYGAVAYNFRIASTEVTIGQYTAFLNAVAATDTYGLYHFGMTSDFYTGGITRNGSAGSYTYETFGSPDRPITYVGWGDVARFANWMHNGQPNGGQNANTTEAGAYTLNGATANAVLNTVARNQGAKWFLPNENEWYKAAYHQPAADGGDSDNYWTYATRTNIKPYSIAPPGDEAPDPTNAANYYNDDGVENGFNGGYAVTDSPNPDQNVLTDVGAYTNSYSYYGTYDQVGSVYEWTETLAGSLRVIRGGSWATERVASFDRTTDNPSDHVLIVGFRMATVPEPGSAALLLLALISLLGFKYARSA